jgi:flagellar motor switch protein FliN
MAAPTLGLGLLVDDHLLRANLGGDSRLPELHTAPWDAFHFFPEGARDAAGIDLGFGAWWQQPGGFARAFRALPSLTHWLGDLVRLKSGTLLELDRESHEPADILVNGKIVAHGEIVTVDNHYGVRITSVEQ